MLKLFSCAVVLHYNHKHNEAIPQSQGFQSAHNSSKVTGKELTFIDVNISIGRWSHIHYLFGQESRKWQLSNSQIAI